jgi:hypothetical protein
MVMPSSTVCSLAVHLNLTSSPELDLTTTINPAVFHSSEAKDISHGAVEQFVDITSSSQIHFFDTDAPPLSSKTMYTSLHEDIAYTLTSLRSSFPLNALNYASVSCPRKANDANLIRSTARPMEFDPQLMPFTVRRLKQQEHLVSLAIGTAPSRLDTGGSVRSLAQLGQPLEHSHDSPDLDMTTSSQCKRQEDVNGLALQRCSQVTSTLIPDEEEMGGEHIV